MNTIITISRQYGSGGKLIGTMVAEELGLPVYDKEIIDKAAQNTGLASGFIMENEQKLKGMLPQYGGTDFGAIWTVLKQKFLRRNRKRSSRWRKAVRA